MSSMRFAAESRQSACQPRSDIRPAAERTPGADRLKPPTCSHPAPCVTIPTMVIRATLSGIAVTFLISLAGSAEAQELPPLPTSLLNASGAVCIKVSRGGAVRGVYLLTGTGNADADKDMVAWARQLHWPMAKPGEKLRDTWFPMPIAFGGTTPVAAPTSCGAPA